MGNKDRWQDCPLSFFDSCQPGKGSAVAVAATLITSLIVAQAFLCAHSVLRVP